MASQTSLRAWEVCVLRDSLLAAGHARRRQVLRFVWLLGKLMRMYAVSRERAHRPGNPGMQMAHYSFTAGQLAQRAGQPAVASPASTEGQASPGPPSPARTQCGSPPHALTATPTGPLHVPGGAAPPTVDAESADRTSDAAPTLVDHAPPAAPAGDEGEVSPLAAAPSTHGAAPATAAPVCDRGGCDFSCWCAGTNSMGLRIFNDYCGRTCALWDDESARAGFGGTECTSRPRCRLPGCQRASAQFASGMRFGFCTFNHMHEYNAAAAADVEMGEPSDQPPPDPPPSPPQRQPTTAGRRRSARSWLSAALVMLGFTPAASLVSAARLRPETRGLGRSPACGDRDGPPLGRFVAVVPAFEQPPLRLSDVLPVGHMAPPYEVLAHFHAAPGLPLVIPPSLADPPVLQTGSAFDAPLLVAPAFSCPGTGPFGSVDSPSPDIRGHARAPRPASAAAARAAYRRSELSSLFDDTSPWAVCPGNSARLAGLMDEGSAAATTKKRTVRANEDKALKWWCDACQFADTTWQRMDPASDPHHILFLVEEAPCPAAASQPRTSRTRCLVPCTRRS